MRAGAIALAVAAASTASASAHNEIAWRQIGPAAAGGRVAAVAGSDRHPYLYYFGGAGGGVFKTSSGGMQWTDVWTRQPVGAIGALALDPRNDDTVWAGTGEPFPRNDASYGDGVWRSRDGGARWGWRGLAHSYAISNISIDPRDSDTVLVSAMGNPFRDGGERGVYRSTDGGITWTRTLYAGPQSGGCDLARDAQHPSVVYAGMWQLRRLPWTFTSGGTQDGLYKSTDGGRSWRKLYGSGLPSGLIGRIGVAVAPSDSRRVYALIQSKSGLLWRSDDAGAHWRLMSRDSIVDQRPFYFSRLTVDPRNRDHVFFASEDLIETRDGGRTFEDISTAVHQDHHGFWISSDGRRIIEADDGGAPISIDGGRTWDWRFNVVLAQTYHVGYDDANPYHVCGAFQDNDSFCGPAQSLSPLGITERDWRDVANDSDGVWAWPDPGDRNSIWNVGVNELNGQLGIFDLTSRQNYDVTPSVTDTNGRALAGIPYRFNWEAPVAFSPRDPRVVYFGGNVVFETRDRGRTWTPISPDLTRNDRAKQQVAGGPINTDVSGAEFYDTLLDIAPSPRNANVIWAGSDDGLVQRTSDGGSHWTNVSPPQSAWGRVETVEPSRFSAERAYAAVDRHLLGDPAPHAFVTDDGGLSWRSITGGLPSDQFVRVIREDPVNPSVLFAGLEQGVWITLDRGAHWESLQLGMPAVSVHDLRVQPQRHDLIAGTHGLGLWILDDLTPYEGLAQARASSAPTLFAPPAAYTWYLWWASAYGTGGGECCVPAGAYSGSDPKYGVLISYYLPASRGGAAIEIVDSDGKLLRRIEVPSTAGLHRAAWDLAVEPPVPWRRARDWNRGPGEGPAVVPGRVRLRTGNGVTAQPLQVLPDPRAPWSHEQYVARFTFLQALDDELSEIDAALNRMDAMRAHGNLALRARIDEVYGQFTSGVVNSEDDQWRPDRVRERLTILQGTVALSQGPPLPPHLLEAQAIRAELERAMDSYRREIEK